MDDLLRDFLTETFESLDAADLELVRFEKQRHDKDALDKIFRLVHTVKGTGGFLGLTRLCALAHAAETVLGLFRDGTLQVIPSSVSMILKSIDRIKEILAGLEAQQREPEGQDQDLIGVLEQIARGDEIVVAEKSIRKSSAGKPSREPSEIASAALERELKPGEVSLEDLEAAFQNTAGPADMAPPPAAGHITAAQPPMESDHAVPTKGASEPSVANQSIRVNVALLERMMTLVSELVLTRNQLMQMVRNQSNSEFKVPLQRLSTVTSDLQDSVMKTRMQPIGNAWSKLPRLVRDLSQDLGKKITLDMAGADTELDRQVLELIRDPMVHMVRNSADHGLEATEKRKNLGKPEAGRIIVRAYHEGGHIIVEVGDDGRGLSVEKIREKALRLGLATNPELDRMSDQQIQRFIFAPGFSTAEKITNVSGRGVGLDVVRTNIEQIGGTIDLDSTPGSGTTFTIKIPLTLAIVSALIVESAGERFAIPQIAVVELVRTKPNAEHRIEIIHDTPVLRLRDRLLPLVSLASVLELTCEPVEQALAKREAFVIVTQVGSRSFGIVVDRVYDTEEIVVKPVTSLLRNVSVYSGNTILGDGSVIMIVDPNGVASYIAHDEASVRAAAANDAPVHGKLDSTTALLLFRTGTSGPRAVRLALVTRLEEVDVEKIERCDGKNLVQYRGRLMSIQPVDPVSGLVQTGRQPILVFSQGERTVGLAVDEIIDIAEENLDIELNSTTPGILGSATIKGHATEILDANYFLTQVYSDWLEHLERATGQAVAQRLLLIDDSPYFLNMLSPLLQAAGYQVTSVNSADEALKLKERGAFFDTIVSDIEMPGTDGFAFARTVRADEKWSKSRLVAFSASVDADMESRGRAAGFDECVSKFERARLMSVLEQLRAHNGVAA